MATYLDYLRKNLGIEMKWDEKLKRDITQETKEKIAQTDRFVAFVSSAISAGAAVGADKAAQAKVDTYAESRDLTKIETPQKFPGGRDKPFAKTISYEGKIGDEFVSFTPSQMTSLQKAELYQGRDFNTIVGDSIDRFKVDRSEAGDWAWKSPDRSSIEITTPTETFDEDIDVDYELLHNVERPSVPVQSETETFDEDINLDLAKLYDLEPISIQASIQESDTSTPFKKEPSALEAINNYYSRIEEQNQEKIAFDKLESKRINAAKQKYRTGNINIFDQKKKPQNPLLYHKYVQMYGEEKARELLNLD